MNSSFTPSEDRFSAISRSCHCIIGGRLRRLRAEGQVQGLRSVTPSGCLSFIMTLKTVTRPCVFSTHPERSLPACEVVTLCDNVTRGYCSNTWRREERLGQNTLQGDFTAWVLVKPRLWKILPLTQQDITYEIQSDFYIYMIDTMLKQLIQLGKKGRNKTEMLHIYRPDLFLTKLSAVFKQLLCSGRSSERTANMKLKWLLMCWNRTLIPPECSIFAKTLRHLQPVYLHLHFMHKCFQGTETNSCLKVLFQSKGHIKNMFLCPHKQSVHVCTCTLSLF